ncbi:hypothetical protein ABZS66_25295 [Dactylosporangium sp. NPDC005572]|uniref:hypothetical protein n=1 Tax=Dactylosporangium sp. NPDC005572 TaxID=3156889 RepID=UPI0033AEB424
MGDGNSRVDLLTLEEFRTRLDSRLTDARALVTKLNGMSKPKLGTFTDAQTIGNNYDRVHSQHLTRAKRLVAAIEAAQKATDDIMRNYHTTESRNTANQADIRNLLGDVTVKLGGSDGQ